MFCEYIFTGSGGDFFIDFLRLAKELIELALLNRDCDVLLDNEQLESHDLSSWRLEYKLFWEFNRTYIRLFSLVISFSLFLRRLKYVLRWLYFLWRRTYLLKPYFLLILLACEYYRAGS
jgi:hypothetical protein